LPSSETADPVSVSSCCWPSAPSGIWPSLFLFYLLIRVDFCVLIYSALLHRIRRPHHHQLLLSFQC
jgi:hypothetical protein